MNIVAMKNTEVKKLLKESFTKAVKNKQFKRFSYDKWRELMHECDAPSTWSISDWNNSGEMVLTNNANAKMFFFDKNDSSFGSFLNHTFNNTKEEENNTMLNTDYTCSTTATSSACDYTVSTCTDSTGYRITSSPITVPYATDRTINNLRINGRDYAIAANTTALDDRIRELEKTINNKKENEKNMKGFNFDFGPVKSEVHMSMYGMAIKNKTGTYVSYNAGTGELMDVDILNFDGSKFLYKMPCALSEVQVGDIIVHNGVPMFVIGMEDTISLRVIDPYAGESKTILPLRSPFGFNFVTRVINFLDGFAGGQADAAHPFGNMLPLLLMGDNKEIDPLMLCMMMGQNGATNMFTNHPMMLYFLTKDNKNMDPMTWMCLSMATGAAPTFMTQKHECSCGGHCGEHSK